MIKLLGRIKSFIPKGNFVRNVTLLVGGTALGQLIVLAVSPLLTRLYSPEDFGYLATYSSILGTILVIGSLRYQLAIPLPEKDEDAFALLLISFMVLISVSAVASLILYSGKELLFTLLNSQPLQNFWWLLPLGLLGAGSYQALSYWSIRKNIYRNLSITKLTQAVGLVVTQVGFGFLNSGVLGLVAGDIIGRTAGSGNLARLTFKAGIWQKISLQRIRQNAWRYRHFPLLTSGSALLNSAGLQLPSLIVLTLYGPQVAGWFTLSQRVLGIPTTILATSVSQVYVGKAAQLARTAPKELSSLFKQTISRLFLIALLPAFTLFILAPQFFTFIFSQEWFQTGQYTQILIPMFLAQFTISPLSQTLIILERQGLQLFWDVGRFFLVLGSLWLSKALAFSDLQAMFVFSLSNFLAYIALLGLNLLALKQMKL